MPLTRYDKQRAGVGAAGEVVRLILASAIAVMLLAGGVYWLHRLPARPGAPESAATVHVQLLQLDDSAPIAALGAQRPMLPESTSPGRADVPAPWTDEALPSPLSAQPHPISQKEESDSASSSRKASSKVAVKFRQELLRHIARYQRYPSSARPDPMERTVQVLFRLRRDGALIDAWVSSSSGDVVLDSEAIATLHRAEPLPSIPAEMPGELRILLPIAFARQ